MAGEGPTLGIDFGTTNTVVAIHEGGQTRILRFPTPDADTVAAFRSVISFQEPGDDDASNATEAGPWAIEAFLDEPEHTRLIQSFKSFAASEAFAGTHIFGKRFQFEDLLTAFLIQLRRRADGKLGGAARTIVGRPVVFAGAQPDEGLALDRYGVAFGRMGFPGLAFAYEPVGAAFFFAKRIEGQATVLVADLGGGTSDFSIMAFERQEDGGVQAQPLSRAGVGVAGDAFDYRIIDNVVSPRLGKGTEYRSGDNLLPVPARYYAAFARWNQLALMKGSRDMREIREISRTAIDSEGLARFLELIRDDQGYKLYQAVSAVKEALSSADSAELHFEAGSIDIRSQISRAAFEGWIAKELAAIERTVDDALLDAKLQASDIDRVFLTGGSSFVPAVRAIFTRRFGQEAIETGGEFESIATGLAMIGADPDAADWCEEA